MRYLSSKAKDLNNNFDLIRVIAAAMVVFGHAYELTGLEPDGITRALGIGVTALGVDIFFVVSGFLVSASLINSKSLWRFAIGRALRIFPGLIVCCLLTAFVLGPIFTHLSLAEYFSHERLYAFVVSKGTIVGVFLTGGGSDLPGVFANNPVAGIANGSLWTLTYELFMYGLVFVCGGLALALMNRFDLVLRGLYGVVLLLCVLIHFDSIPGLATDNEVIASISRFGLCFFLGGLLYLFKDKVVLSWGVFFLALVCIAFMSYKMPSYLPSVLYYAGLAYAVIFLAYSQRVFASRFNRKNDYSYGLYIYAFPIQQATVDLLPGIHPMGLMVLAGLLTLAMAAMSWHLVEKQSLQFKTKLVKR